MVKEMTWPSTGNASLWTSQMAFDTEASTVVTIPDDSSPVLRPVRWGAVLLVLIVIATVFGNVLLCLAVMTERRLQNMTNYFLASLAVADLLVALLVMPPAVIVEIYGQSLSFCRYLSS